MSRCGRSSVSGHKGRCRCRGSRDRGIFDEPTSWRRKQNSRRRGQLQALNAVPLVQQAPPVVRQAPPVVRQAPRVLWLPISQCVMCQDIHVGSKDDWHHDQEGEVARRVQAAGLRLSFSYCSKCLARYGSVRIITLKAQLMRDFGHLTMALVVRSA